MVTNIVDKHLLACSLLHSNVCMASRQWHISLAFLWPSVNFTTIQRTVTYKSQYLISYPYILIAIAYFTSPSILFTVYLKYSWGVLRLLLNHHINNIAFLEYLNDKLDKRQNVWNLSHREFGNRKPSFVHWILRHWPPPLDFARAEHNRINRDAQAWVVGVDRVIMLK